MSSIQHSAERRHEPAGDTALFSIEALGVRFGRAAPVVEDVSLTVGRGECLGVVGESGAGKSLAFLAALGLAPGDAEVTGRACFGGRDLLAMPERDLDAIRGRRIGMVFQDPMGALTPHLSIGAQLAEPIARHNRCGARAARSRALELLEQVHLGEPQRRMGQYPHELSGGMRQRVMIAIALACEPELIILDEPTTALDVTLEAQILALLAHIKRERHIGLVVVTHDFAALAGIADRVAVMRAGRVIESGTATEVFKHPREPYTRELVLAASEAALAPAATARHGAGATGAPVVAVSGLAVRYRHAAGLFRGVSFAALEDVTFALAAGESLAVVGESGCGKSTLTRAALRLIGTAGGRVEWLGRDVSGLAAPAIRRLRRDLQLIFQDPLASLDPHLTVERLVGEPLEIHEAALGREARRARVVAMLERVGLDPGLGRRRPHELSGGQCQRVGIARAMILAPRLLVCDEPLSALDVRAQRQISLLLETLRREQGMSLLFVSHDLAAVRRLCERVLVLYRGRMVELGASAVLLSRPLHPYARELLEAVPVADPQLQPGRLARVRLEDIPEVPGTGTGCAFRARCPHATALCAEQSPPWVEASGGHWVACHHFGQWADGMLGA